MNHTEQEHTENAALQQQIQAELRDNILPFWIDHALDTDTGGFYSAIRQDLTVERDGERALVFCARMLWTFSAAYRFEPDPRYWKVAQHAYTELVGRFLDPVYGGFYWTIDSRGQPVNPRKQIYGQAFAIYALAEMALASGSSAPLQLAQEVYRLVELHAFDPNHGGYIEGCARDWSMHADMRLSAKEAYDAPKSMNTLLHVLEAYSNLLRVWPNDTLKTRLSGLIDVFLDHVIDPETGFNRLFFNMDWFVVDQSISYGHDIEAAWLLCEAAELLQDLQQIERVQQAALRMADAVLAQGMDQDGSIFYEGDPRGITNDQKHWWVHAEGMVGFYNAYQLTAGREQRYRTAAMRLWQYIQQHFVDPRFGEWHKLLDRFGTPIKHFKAGPWEDPYHQSRACMEMLRRLANKR